MKLLTATPEQPITEDWQWQTDVIVSTDGTEQRISLCEFPKRTLNIMYACDTEAEVNAVTHAMMLSGAGLAVPFFHAATRLTAPAPGGATALSFYARRTDLRDGCAAVLFDATGRIEPVTVDTVSEFGCSLAGAVAGDWGLRSSIAAVWPMYASGSLAVSRNNPDYAATLKAGFTDLQFMEPFANEFAPHDFTMFKGYPILPVNSVGNEFEQSYDTGATTTDYGGVGEIRNLWAHAQVVMPRNFLCQRVLEPASWNMWRALADYAKGSANPFFVPTFRNDFEMQIMPSGGAAGVVFEGLEYLQAYYPFEPFKQLAFTFADGSVHYASVTNCVATFGASSVTFAPPIPGDKGEATKVSLLLKVRIADDKVSCQHEALQTIIAINLRTAD